MRREPLPNGPSEPGSTSGEARLVSPSGLATGLATGPATGPATGTVRAPPSKSHAIRELVLSALATGTSTLRYVPEADDVRRAVAGLASLGFGIRHEGDALQIEGASGRIPRPTADLFLGGSGTTLRLFAGLAALGPGPYRLDGDATLRARPLGGLEDALRAAGARVETTRGCAPLTVRGPLTGSLPAPGSSTSESLSWEAGDVGDLTAIAIDASRSSQGASALALIGCALSDGWEVRTSAAVASSGYIDLTLRCLRARGVQAQRLIEPDGSWTISVPHGPPAAADVCIDGDWSSAAFLLALGPVTGGSVRVTGLPRDGQPDRRVLDVLRAFGADVQEQEDGAAASGTLTRPIEMDLSEAPDLAPLVGALACCVPGTTRVRGAAHLRIKESDRIATVVEAATRFGCQAVAHSDGFDVVGPPTRPAETASEPVIRINPHQDHRLAMAFAVAGMATQATAARRSVLIEDAGCVSKSFPGFWDAVARLKH